MSGGATDEGKGCLLGLIGLFILVVSGAWAIGYLMRLPV